MWENRAGSLTTTPSSTPVEKEGGNEALKEVQRSSSEGR
jgi:hypothetical protein